MTRRAFFVFILFSFTGIIFAQDILPRSASLSAEIQNTEKTVNGKGVPDIERHDALVRLARLRQLSGDIEGAAKNWLSAAAAVPGKVDDDALLSCAYCLAAMGEWDRVGAALEPLLQKSARARFLDAGVKAVKTNNADPLTALVNNSSYSQMKSEIYFMLWKIYSGDNDSLAEAWRERLITEFPQSPEGRLAAGATPAVVVKPSPFMFFLGGYDSLPVVKTEPVIQPAAVTQPEPEKAAPPVTVTVPAAVTAPPPAVKVETVKLQTGVFGQKANAEALIAKLRTAGFSPLMESRTGSNGEMWAVIVPAGQDANLSIRELKNAGFDSFPLR